MMEENLLSHSEFFALMFSFKRIYSNINKPEIFLYILFVYMELCNRTNVSWALCSRLYFFFIFPFIENNIFVYENQILRKFTACASS